MFKHFYRYILFLIIIFCSIFSAHCQHLDKRSTYPFKVNVSVQGSSVYLSDYANEFSCPVSIYLTCLDPSITRISVRLQIGIKAGGFTCQTTPYATVTPIDISFGQTYHLTDAEVAEYFLPQNISHSGLVNGRMPESLADFTVQVLEYNTGVKLSSVAYTMRPLRLLSPVRLISPLDKSSLTEDRASNILFTWSSSTPPNATDQVEYEFILKELTDTISSVQSAFNYAPIVYTETTPLTSLIYSLDKPALEVGKKYAWCVKTTVIPADGVNGKQYVDNAGYSTVYSFEVSRPTPAPVNSQITKTEEEPYHNPHCGEAPVIDLSNKTPIESLKVGDTIMAGDFPIVLLEVTGSGGTFSGKGSVEIPWISRLLRFAVEFEGIGVNTDKRLISGQIEGVRNGTLDNIANLDAIDYGSTREVEKAVTSADISLGVTLPNAPPPSIAYNPTSQLLTFYNETGAVVAETTLNNPQGKKVFPITVQDAEGNLYQVEETTNEDGTAEHSITHVGKQGKHLPYKSFGTNVIDEHIAIVTFEPTDSPYSFDTYQEYYKDIPLIYKKNTLYPDLRYPHMGHGYYTPWQFIPLGEKVTLSAKIKINDKKAGIDPKKVIFTTEEGLSVATSYNEKEKTYTLTVPSAQSEGYYILHALYQTHDDFFYHLGQIGIDTRKPISARVVLVPMGGDYNLGSLSAGINSISKQVGLTWQVEEYTDFEYSSELTANLFEKNSGVLFSYNDVQTVLNSALKAQLGNKFDPSACYVFMFDKAPFKNDRNIIGFMPRGGKFGYIHCQGLSSESLAQILTHELMHGQFLLRHTFDDKYANGLKQGVNPTNLMDYKGGRHIAKWQWDQIYDPAITTSLIKYDEDGELAVTIISYLTRFGVNTAINICSELLVYRLTDPDVHSWEDAWNKVDCWRAVVYGAVDLINVKKLKIAAEFVAEFALCLKDKGNIIPEDFGDCGLTALADLVLERLTPKQKDLAVLRLGELVSDNTSSVKNTSKKQLSNLTNKLAGKLVDYPNLNKKVTELGELGKLFLEDFEELASKEIKYLDTNITLVDVWKKLYKKGASKFTRQLIAHKINIENVRPGTNGKYAIIGRDMKQVESAADILKETGVEVEILDDKWLKGKTYYIPKDSFTSSKGVKIEVKKEHWNISEAFNDMIYNSDYEEIRDGKGFINDINDIQNLPMYKLNKMWIEEIKNKGYEIIDIGNPSNKEGISHFYNMEKMLLNFK